MGRTWVLHTLSQVSSEHPCNLPHTRCNKYIRLQLKYMLASLVVLLISFIVSEASLIHVYNIQVAD